MDNLIIQQVYNLLTTWLESDIQIPQLQNIAEYFDTNSFGIFVNSGFAVIVSSEGEVYFLVQDDSAWVPYVTPVHSVFNAKNISQLYLTALSWYSDNYKNKFIENHKDA